MKSRWIIHEGARVFIADFSYQGHDGAAIAAECESIKAALAEEPAHSVLSITYVEGTLANEDIIGHLVKLVPQTNKYIKKRGVVGVSGYRRHLLYAFTKVVGELKFSVFDTMDEALAWVVK
jgi:hypothetical protein